jgi:hypothetical protein
LDLFCFCLPLFTKSTVVSSSLEIGVCVLAFFGISGLSDGGLGFVTRLSFFRLAEDSSWSGGGTTLPCERSCILVLLEDQEECIAFLREVRLDKSPLVSPRDESSSSSKAQTSHSETALPSQKKMFWQTSVFLPLREETQKRTVWFFSLGYFYFCLAYLVIIE